MVNQNLKVSPQDIINSKSAVCEECNHDKFKNEFIIKVISALLSPSGKELHVPIPVFSCGKCGHVNKAFLPDTTQA